MRRRRRRGAARYRDDYYDDEDYYGRRRRLRGPNIIQRFFITLLWIVCIIIAITLLVLIAFHYALFVKILVYVLYVVGMLSVLGAFYLAIRIITLISLRISEARRASALAKQERVRIKQEQERIKLAQSKRAREEYAFYNRQTPTALFTKIEPFLSRTFL
jgi:type VI protein secretion system component VasK